MAEGGIKLDLTEGMKDEESLEDFHSCGIGRFRLNQDTLVCVDGQQRLTTTSLIVAAVRFLTNEGGSRRLFQLTLLLLRDKLKGLKEVDLCREANKLLVSDVDFFEGPDDLTKSRIQSKLRLLPSQPDR